MRHSVSASLVVSLTLSLSACVDLDDESPAVGSNRGAVVTEQGVRLQGVRLQGVRLQGVRLQGVRLQGVRLQGVRLQGVRLQGSNITGTETECRYYYYWGRLVRRCTDYTRAGTELIGATLDSQADDGTVFTMRIADARRDPVDPDIWLYDVEMRDPDTGAWYDICPADASGRTSAIAVDGYWDDTGAHHDSSDLFTFGCTVGVIYKCASWGYKPWGTHQFYQNGFWITESLSGYHQACTRMARADYCGTGISNTEDGTAIDVEDTAGIQSEDPSWTKTFEGGWNEDGVVCFSEARLGSVTIGDADCLTDYQLVFDGTTARYEYTLPRCESREEAYANHTSVKLTNETITPGLTTTTTGSDSTTETDTTDSGTTDTTDSGSTTTEPGTTTDGGTEVKEADSTETREEEEETGTISAVSFSF